MAIFTVDRLAELCGINKETVRRWRNRGVNGVKLQALTDDQQRGVSLMFDEDAIRSFMEKNPKYMTDKLNAALNGNYSASSIAASAPHPEVAAQHDNYARQVLKQQQQELRNKLQDVERTLQILTSSSAAGTAHPESAAQYDSYARQILTQQQQELRNKLQDVNFVLNNLK